MGLLVRPARSKRVRWLAVALITLLTGCNGSQVLTALTPGPPVQAGLVFDVAHDLRLDVYAPPAARNAPVVVFFYGGRWSGGSRRDYGFVGKALASRGWVVVVPDYRLYPVVRYPQFLDDCAQAVLWARQHAGRFGGDSERLVLMGHSAGAYNAAMLALRPGLLGSTGNGAPGWLRGVVGVAGPYDFLPITDPVLREVFGPSDQWPQTQPVNHVATDTPPLLLVHGTADTTVRPRNSASLTARVTAHGGSATQLLLPGLDHIWPLIALAGPLRWRAPVLDRIDDFLRQVTASPGA